MNAGRNKYTFSLNKKFKKQFIVDFQNKRWGPAARKSRALKPCRQYLNKCSRYKIVDSRLIFTRIKKITRKLFVILGENVYISFQTLCLSNSKAPTLFNLKQLFCCCTRLLLPIVPIKAKTRNFRLVFTYTNYKNLMQSTNKYRFKKIETNFLVLLNWMKLRQTAGWFFMKGNSGF